MQRLWVLKKQPYRETSLLITFVVDSDCVYRGVVRGGRGKCAEFQPLFAELRINDSGLVGVSKLEEAAARVPLTGKALIGALYANEIITHLVPEGGELVGLFDQYTAVLTALARQEFVVLRRLERLLLTTLGAYPELAVDQYGDPLIEDQWYRLHQHQSLVAVEPSAPDALAGVQWMTLASAEFRSGESVPFATWLHRGLIDAALNGKRLVSRELLQ